MTIRNLVVIALACGCGGVNSNPQSPDAPSVEEIDAPRIDIDAPPALASHHYVIDKHILPVSNAQARELGLDLNDDATVDNQLGLVMATFVGQGIETQPGADRAIDRGEILTLVDLEANGFADGDARFALYTGENPQPSPCANGADTVCRRHLDGNGTFDVASAPDAPLVGELAGGVLLTEAGRLHVGLSLMSAPTTYELLGARVKVTSPSDAEITSGVIAGAITQSDVDLVLIPSWALEIDAIVAADCPGAPPTCGCAGGSQGGVYHSLYDANQDCSVSAQELRTNSLIMSLLAPDVTIEGAPAISLGFGFTAKKATYTE
jgi:hypothetical protein